MHPAPGHPNTRHISPGLSAPEDLQKRKYPSKSSMKRALAHFCRMVFVSRVFFKPRRPEMRVHRLKKGPIKKYKVDARMTDKRRRVGVLCKTYSRESPHRTVDRLSVKQRREFHGARSYLAIQSSSYFHFQVLPYNADILRRMVRGQVTRDAKVLTLCLIPAAWFLSLEDVRYSRRSKPAGRSAFSRSRLL